MNARTIGAVILLAITLSIEIAGAVWAIGQALDEMRAAQPVAIFAGCTAHIPQRMYDRTTQQFSDCPGGDEYWIIKIPNKEKPNGLQADARRQRGP